MKEFLRSAANVVPSERQLNWFDTEFYGFVHFSPNTYTNLEWGLGNEDPAVFNPIELDCNSWVNAFKSAGIKGMVLTAKHHDGFCLWQTAHTDHSIKSSPFKNGKGDIVREASEACRRGGIKFGFYLSPWDRNSKYYGTPEYNDYYKAQLTELLTGYGDIFMVWFDGACGEGPNGKKQEYDFEGYVELVRKYQPNAVIFGGPDVRWCGNEAGSSRTAEWAVVPSELCPLSEVQTSAAPMTGNLDTISHTDPDIGSISNIMYSKGLVFCGSEIDMSIRPGWFYHPNENPHSVDRLFNTYLNSVGGNACFHLNVPPMPNGRFADPDIARLNELGCAIRSAFSSQLDPEIIPLECIGETQRQYSITFAEDVGINYLVLSEDISNGQRIESFKILIKNPDGTTNSVYNGATVGHKKICKLGIKARELILYITAARDRVYIKDIKLF